MTAMIEYRTGNNLNLEEVIELYRRSTLGERRPVDDRARFEAMIANANLVISAWDGPAMVGISRSITDWVYMTYLSDLAVHADWQRQGIGKELMRRTQAAAPQARLLLLAAPAAQDYYPHVGFTHHPQAWWIGPSDPIR